MFYANLSEQCFQSKIKPDLRQDRIGNFVIAGYMAGNSD